MTKKAKFNSIQFIRVLAFLNVFLLHSKCFRSTSLPENAAWAVSFFFMISGFLYGYRYYNDSNLKLSSTIKFTVSKLVKIYPLYIVTTLLMLPFSEFFKIGRGEDIWFFVRKLFYNIFLLQSFSFDKKIAYAFTGVGWYLSTFMFLILLTIPIIKFLKYLINKKGHIIFSLILVILLSFAYVDLLTMYNYDSYYIYVFPLARLFEYIAAILLGFLLSDFDFNKKVTIKKRLLYTIIELLLIVGILVLFVYSDSLINFNLDVLWIIPNLLLIAVFCKEYGFISKLFGNKFFVHLGGLTFDTYLIHEVLIMYVYVVPGLTDGIRLFEKFGLLIFCFVMSFVIAEYTQKNSIFDSIGKKIVSKM